MTNLQHICQSSHTIVFHCQHQFFLHFFLCVVIKGCIGFVVFMGFLTLWRALRIHVIMAFLTLLCNVYATVMNFNNFSGSITVQIQTVHVYMKVSSSVPLNAMSFRCVQYLLFANCIDFKPCPPKCSLCIYVLYVYSIT